MVGDLNEQRLAQAKSFGCEIPVEEQITRIVGLPEVDCFVDCVGFEADGHGTKLAECRMSLLSFSILLDR